MSVFVNSLAFFFGRTAGKRTRASRSRTRRRTQASHLTGSGLESLEPRHALSGTGLIRPAVADVVPGDTSTREIIQINGSRAGTVNYLGDHDWYRVSLVAGMRYEFRLNATGGTGVPALGDPFLRLRFDNGYILFSDDDAGGNHNSKITTGISTSGTYLLDAGAWDDKSTGGYTLTVTQLTPTPADDFAADASTTGMLQLYRTQRKPFWYAEGKMERSGDRDWFRVSLVPGRTYQITVWGSQWGSGAGQPLSNPYVYLRDQRGNSLAYNDNYTFRWNDARITFTVPKSTSNGAVFYIDVGAMNYPLQGPNYDLGMYKIRMELIR